MMMMGRKEGKGRKDRGWVEGRKGYKCGVIGVLQTHKLRLIGESVLFIGQLSYPQVIHRV